MKTLPGSIAVSILRGLVPSLLGLLMLSGIVQAQNPAPVQTFYLPVPEGQLLQALQSIEGGATWVNESEKPANPIHYYISIASVAAGTVIYYDQMEDGYESDISEPTSIYDPVTNPSGTQIWGDGDPANGFPPGIPTDVINAGTVIILSNPINTGLAPDPAAPLFRAGDKISSSKAIAMTMAGWASGSQTLLAGANEIFDTVSWGKNYRIPVGENIPDADDSQMFEYSGAAIMAGKGGASVQIDANADGIFESTVQLMEGKSHLINGGLAVGGRVVSDNPVQVDLMTGDRQDGYESRFFRLLPTELWANSYYSPVSTPGSAQGTSGTSTSVWLYNPSASPLSVTYDRRNSTNFISNVSNKTTAHASAPLTGSAPGNVYGQIVELNSDGTLTGASPEGAWIGIVNRSSSNNPTIESKITNAQNAGAAAVIVVRNSGGTTLPTETAGSPAIPVVGMTQNNGASLRAAGLGAGWVRVSGNTTSSTISVPAGSYAKQVLTDGYGARFHTESGQAFYALSTTDSAGTTLSENTAGSNRTWDWGFTLVPESSLTPQVLIGLGIGRDPTSAVNPNENGNPVWITTTGNGNSNATVFVDYDSNPTTGPFTDPNGNRYDLALTLREFESVKVYNPSGNQTGMLLYTLDSGVKLAAAWGQDVQQASAGQPGLDMGTGIPPLPQFIGSKKSVLFVDNDADGFVSPGDVLEYTIVITNISRVPVSDLELEDVLPTSLVYLPGTTTFKNSQGVISNIPDAATGSPFPIDDGGIIIPEASLPPNGGTWEISYQTTVAPSTSLAIGELTVINSATIGGTAVADPIVLQESQVIYGQIGDRVWVDANGNGLQDSGETGIPGITVRLLDAGLQVSQTAITDENGNYRFFGVLPADYRVEFTAPTGYHFSPANADGSGLNGAANSDANALTGRTSVFSLAAGEHRLTVDAGLIPVFGPLGILKTSNVDGTISPGQTIDYTVVVTNSGLTAQTNVTVTDVLPSQLSYISGSIAASMDPPLISGGDFIDTYDSNGNFLVPDGVTNLTVEAWGAGGGGGKSSTANNNAGGGGGGGGFARSTVSVTPNSSLTVNVGLGGSAGNKGGDSWFGGPTTVLGAGGLGGGGSSTSGGDGGSLNLGNLATFNGGNGGNGHSDGSNDDRRGGGGGGSATNTAIGGNGSNGGSASGGAGGSGMATGGNGRQGSNNGINGSAPGGGGGGGGRNGIGGNGGNGRVRVSYTIPAGVAGITGAPPNLASGWTIPAGGTLTLTFQAMVNASVTGTQIVNTASVTSNETPEPGASSVFDSLTPGGISGFVLADANGDASEFSGIQGVLLTLLDAHGDPILDHLGNSITTTTDADGFYQFGNLAPGVYQVNQTQPSAYLSVSDADGGDPDHIGSNSPIEVLSAQTSDQNNFIEILPASVSGSVFAVTTLGGAGDLPLAGVTLQLLDGAGNPLATTTTETDGSYSFTGLRPGDYQVSQTQPAGYASVSDADGGNPDRIVLNLSPGDDLTNQDFIEIQFGSVSGHVFADTNNDGEGDAPLQTVSLTLVNSADESLTIQTDENGYYAFTQVIPGVYQIQQSQPSGYGSVSDVDGGNPDLIGDVVPLTIAPGQAVTGRDFVEIQLGTISGFVFVQEDPLAGVTLVLLDASGNPVLDGSGNPITAVTASDGSYTFSNVRPGVYQVGQIQPLGYENFGDSDGGDLDVVGDITPIVVGPGQHAENNNFIENIDTCPDDWNEWKFQHPGQTADGNPDLDAHDNLTEFAFAMATFSGAGDPFCIRSSADVAGTLEGVFTRPKGAVDHVTYVLEYSAQLGAPTVWQSIELTPDVIIATDNGDCTETIIIPGLEYLTNLENGTGFVRIRVELDDDQDEEIDHTAWTAVEGWRETAFGLCCQTYNQPYLRCAVFTGTIDSDGIAGQTIRLIESAGSVNLSSLLEPGAAHYMEVTTGEYEGHRFDILTADGAELTLVNESDLHSKDAPFSTWSGDLPENLAGSAVIIRRHWTLDDIYPPESFGATNSQSSADQVQVFAGGQWTIYWLYNDNGSSRWVDAADAGMADSGATVIPPGQGMFFFNKTSEISLLSLGEVRENAFVRPLQNGSNLVGGGYPVDQSSNLTRGRAMNPGNGFFGSRDSKTADSFFIWKGDSMPGLSTYDTYWLMNGAPVSPALLRWVKVGDSMATPRDMELLLPGNRASFLRSGTGLPAYRYPAPWSP